MDSLDGIEGGAMTGVTQDLGLGACDSPWVDDWVMPDELEAWTGWFVDKLKVDASEVRLIKTGLAKPGWAGMAKLPIELDDEANDQDGGGRPPRDKL